MTRDRRVRTAKTLSQREAQVVALIQVGATKTVKYNFGEITNVTSTEKNDSSIAVQATSSQ